MENTQHPEDKDKRTYQMVPLRPEKDTPDSHRAWVQEIAQTACAMLHEAGVSSILITLEDDPFTQLEKVRIECAGLGPISAMGPITFAKIHFEKQIAEGLR